MTYNKSWSLGLKLTQVFHKKALKTWSKRCKNHIALSLKPKGSPSKLLKKSSKLGKPTKK
jgi:hypothetical protein